MQNAFVNAYMDTDNGVEAVKATKYSQVNPHAMASQLLTNPRIKAEIAKRRSALATRVVIDQDMLTTKLYDIAKDEDEPGSTRVTAIVHLGKWLGFYVDRKEIAIDQHVTHGMKDLSHEQLLALIEPEPQDAIEGEYTETPE